MPKPYVMTLMAANRVGVMAALTTALDELGGNLRDVSQTVTGNYFTMLLTADFPDDRPVGVINDHIRAFCDPFGIELTLRPLATTDLPEAASNGKAPPTERYSLTVVGPDRRGSLRQVCYRLAHHGVDIADLHASTLPGSDHFVARFALTVPRSIDRNQLQKELAELSESTGSTITMQHHLVGLATQSPVPIRLPNGG
ncbi:MAG: hypothetical protein C0478_08705 [Planctomyces sp.]|nr:hypothetical protein [Planctomyces sp.]